MMEEEDKLPWIKIHRVSRKNCSGDALMTNRLSMDHTIGEWKGNGFFLKTDQARALYKGAKIILDLSSTNGLGREMLDHESDMLEEATSLLRKGLGE